MSRVTDKVAVLKNRNRLSDSCLEFQFTRPDTFVFSPGQKIVLRSAGFEREYSIASSPDEQFLTILFRVVEKGLMSTNLSELAVGDEVRISEPFGFFVPRDGTKILICTGTGVAPFLSYIRSGENNFLLLHGLRELGEMVNPDVLQAKGKYIACITREKTQKDRDIYGGRVTEYLKKELQEGEYTFYLCGNGEMIEECIQIIDRKFSSSRIYTESFF